METKRCKHIIIFTTHPTSFSDSNEGLLKYLGIKNNGEFKDGGEYTIFGFFCMGKYSDDRVQHWESICSSVVEQCKATKDVESITIFTHGKDICCAQHNLFPIVWNEEGAVYGGNEDVRSICEYITEELKDIVADKKDIYITAFSHVENFVNGSLQVWNENSSLGEFWSNNQQIHNEWLVDGGNAVKKDDIRWGIMEDELSSWFDIKVEIYEKNAIRVNSPFKNNKKPKLNLLYFPVTALMEYQDEDFFSKIVDHFFDKEKLQGSMEPAPVLFVADNDILQESNPVIPFSLSKKRRFLDFSIWTRFFALDSIEPLDNLKQLKDVIDIFTWAFQHNLYKKTICKEFIEFQGRLLKTSYLFKEFGSGHSQKVYPFVFHSESKMAQKAHETFKALKIIERKLKWNILMVDDFSDKQLREGTDAVQPGDAISSKEAIIKDMLSETFPISTADNAIVNAFKSVNTPVEAAVILGCEDGLSGSRNNFSSPTETKDKYAERNYDIILLDYLFSEELGYSGFGTDLLNYIKKSTERTHIGLTGSYWIYPMTVFNEAIQSNMQESGYQYSDEHWQMVRGADPINTPQLFRSTLFDFMKTQLDRVSYTEEELWKFLTDNPIVDSSPDAKGLYKRQLCIRAYRLFIEKFSVDEGFPEKSALGNAVKNNMISKVNVKGLRDHIRDLYYLLGYTTGYDFTVIEREYQAIEDAFHISTAHFNDKKSTEEKLGLLAKMIYSIEGKYY